LLQDGNDLAVGESGSLHVKLPRRDWRKFYF
jgi:hypothetical protein